MTIATKTATIEEYMELVVSQGDVDTFLNECFGTGDDFDSAACDLFAESVQPVIEGHLRKMIDEAEVALSLIHI